MWIQKIPKFESGRILKREMMTQLSGYVYQAGALLHEGCANGIVSGCRITTTEDSLIVNPGAVYYERQLYLIDKAQHKAYAPTDEVCVLQLVLHDAVQTDSFVSRELELALTKEQEVKGNGMELCRFRLQRGARLRDTYRDFADRQTEYDTLNTIHAPFCALEEPTLSPEITRHFAQEALAAGAAGEDAAFCMLLLSGTAPVQAQGIRAYLRQTLGQQAVCKGNLPLYQGLHTRLKQLRGEALPVRASHAPRMMILD